MLRLALAFSAITSNACLEVPEKPPADEVDESGGQPFDGGGPPPQGLDGAVNQTGSIDLTGTAWLTAQTITVRFSDVSAQGAPFIAIYSELSPSAVTSFRIPFDEGERVTSGSHSFDPLPAGSYAARLVFDADKVAQELAFTVRADSDGDRTADDDEECPLDPGKTSKGICGCGVVDSDGNGDGAADCIDECPDDPAKMSPGVCDCGVPDVDSDGDGTMDCDDDCPDFDGKVLTGTCGCTRLDTDTDMDDTPDCNDGCPADKTKTSEGLCGCGTPEGSCVTPECPAVMLPNTKLLVGEKRCSPNGQFTFILGTDGYVTLREGDQILWSAFQSAPAISLNLQGTDGNLVARKPSVPGTSSAVWASGTTKSPGATLTVEDSGSVVLRHSGMVVWSVGPFESGETVCREAVENQTLQLVCPAGRTISAVEFASYGRPTGACGSYEIASACHYADSQSKVETACLGENTCELPVTFPSPCSGTKEMVVAYACSGIVDNCPDDAAKTEPGLCGCGKPESDADEDADDVPDCIDGCPADPNKDAAGACGCGVVESNANSDGDGALDCVDGCPADGNKIAPGSCGCGAVESNADSDGDQVLDCIDGCPTDGNKSSVGLCGCNVADTNTDGDNTPDCSDECPNDENKADPGLCGCGEVESSADADSDDVLDCNDDCPTDPNKSAAGVCGCGIPESDADSDGDLALDCLDECPNDPNKTDAGVCGCGIEEGDCPPACTSALLPNTKLSVGEKRCSANGRFKLILGTDGYVTFREGNQVLWSAFQSAPAISLNLQGSDGNLVARKPSVPGTSSAVWSAGIKDSGGAILTVEDSGSAVVRYSDAVVWSIGPFQSGDTTCREAAENQTLQLVCPAGKTISSIDFASYGRPTGACGSYAINNSCHFAGSQSAVDAAQCVGKNTCELLVDPATFTSPCSGTKRLAVAYKCAE